MTRYVGGIGLRIIGERGQVTLPYEIRKIFGLNKGDYVVVRAIDNKIIITKYIIPEENLRIVEGGKKNGSSD